MLTFLMAFGLMYSFDKVSTEYFGCFNDSIEHDLLTGSIGGLSGDNVRYL